MSRTVHEQGDHVPAMTLVRKIAAAPRRYARLSAVLLGSVMAIAPAPALASVSMTAIPELPGVVTVGDTDVRGALLVTNHNAGEDVAMTLCNAGDPGLCAGDPGITLTPSCGALQPSCALPDPGVISIDTTARGTDGTACASKLFLVSLTDLATGRFRFAPAGGSVVLPTQRSACRIEFTFDVLRFPSRDALPGPGTQTGQFGTARGVSNQGSAISGFGTGAMTVKAGPTITAAPSRAVVLGGAVSDSVALAGAVDPPGGSVTFRLFGPDDLRCAYAERFSAAVPISPDATATSPAFTPTTAGTYRWIASYTGDDSNNPATTGCGETNQVIVTPPPPPPPPCADCDGDGYPSSVDCKDNDATIHPGARDKPGNKRDEDCSGRDAPYERLPSRFSYDVLFYGRSTVFSTLHVRQVRAGSSIRVTCSGKRCPFQSRARAVKRNAELVNLSRLLRRARLPTGTRLELRVTNPGTIGIVRRLRIRTRLSPKAVDRCLPPGSRHTTACRL